MRYFRLGLVLCLLSGFFLTASPARADISPPSPPKGANVEPEGKTTNVRMMAETVFIQVHSYSLSPTGSADVTANFKMRNLGTIEEKMDVRFPLYANEHDDDPYLATMGTYFYPPLENFVAWVDGNEAQVYYTEVEFQKPPGSGDDEMVTVPGWANFPVTFPPGKDVNIRVQYRQRGYGFQKGAYASLVSFDYVLYTGAAWNGTIGSADIVVRLPIEVSDMPYFGYSPKDAVYSGYDIHWHLVDFEPSYGVGTDIIHISILQPKYYFAIQEWQKAVAVDPLNGDAWGHLGKAYKEAGMDLYGWKFSNALFEKAVQAYQRAVDLLPEDAAWHYGYADLLCTDVFWKITWSRNTGLDYPGQLHACYQQLDRALALDPTYKKDVEHFLLGFENQGRPDPGEPQPGYPLFLTPVTTTPTLTFTPTRSPTPRATSTPTITQAPTKTPQSTITLTPRATATSLPTPTAAPSSALPVCGSALLPLLLILLFSFRYWRR